MTCFFDQAVQAQSLDGPLPTDKGKEQLIVIIEEQVEATEGTPVFLCRSRYFMNSFLFGIGIVDTGHESKVAHVRFLHELA